MAWAPPTAPRVSPAPGPLRSDRCPRCCVPPGQASGVQSSSPAELLQTYTPGSSAPQVLSNLLHVLTTAAPLKVLADAAGQGEGGLVEVWGQGQGLAVGPRG